MKPCDVCHATCKPKHCGRCGKRAYCGVACQKADWASHKARCQTKRPARCAVCAAPQAGYYCGHCRHFDDSGAHTFHCPFCDVCRRGHGLGVDFHHCMRCNMCVDITQLATHVCTGAAGRACGACGGDLAATPDRVVVLGCGHPAHARCAAAPPGRCLVCARAAATD